MLSIFKTLPNAETPLKSDSTASQRVRKRKTTLEGKQLENFNRFWAAYPKKVSVANAEKAWLKLNPDEETVELILKDIRLKVKKYLKWTKDNGAYIEHPATYLNSQNWRDQITPNMLEQTFVYDEDDEDNDPDNSDELKAEIAEMQRESAEKHKRYTRPANC